ncbi:signal recognition particle protein, partial [Mammaliicoccus sciuri]|nr:signal recognition particle protein [Mammaliicoccus sciuri]
KQITENALKYAREEHLDFVIIDTAGRLHIDEALMNELVDVKEVSKPDEIMLVVDSMTGQDAVNVAESFDNTLDVTGVTLTKLDGDTRGGAALSIRSVTEKPIKFIGMSEKLDGLELFHPERMASRILGMGDVLSLIEKAQQGVDEEKAKELEKKMRTSSFTFDDFLEQLEQVKGLGSLDDLMNMIPGANKMKGMKNANMDPKQIDNVQAIIRSMTLEERNNPDILNVSRKRRIAKGSGRSLQEVNRLIKQFGDMKKMMKQFTGSNKKGKKGKRGGNPFQ